jgi:hypothetical protein
LPKSADCGVPGCRLGFCMAEYTVTRATKTVGTEVQRGWVVEPVLSRKHPGHSSILFNTKMEAVREANRLALEDAKQAKEQNA